MAVRKPSPFKRTGLHRLECVRCAGYVYATVAQLETVGLPRCACGADFTPDRLELAMLLGLHDAPVALEYAAKVRSVEHGQAGPGRARPGVRFRDPTLLAAEHVERNRATVARQRRLGAIAPTPDPMPF